MWGRVGGSRLQARLPGRAPDRAGSQVPRSRPEPKAEALTVRAPRRPHSSTRVSAVSQGKRRNPTTSPAPVSLDSRIGHRGAGRRVWLAASRTRGSRTRGSRRPRASSDPAFRGCPRPRPQRQQGFLKMTSGAPGGSEGQASAFGRGHDPGVQG
uniref:Uncharacterized protein n=1 Tax=Mustela putorius furo TaxID=9669 RepID=M3XUA2_MUSPF